MTWADGLAEPGRRQLLGAIEHGFAAGAFGRIIVARARAELWTPTSREIARRIGLSPYFVEVVTFGGQETAG